MDGETVALALGGPYLLFLLSALAPFILGTSLQLQSAAQALFWMQAVFTLSVGSLVMGLVASLFFPPLALVYAPGQLAVFLISLVKAPGSGRSRGPLALIAAAGIPGVLVYSGGWFR